LLKVSQLPTEKKTKAMQTATKSQKDRRLASEDITSLSTLHVERVRVETQQGEIVDRLVLTDKGAVDPTDATHQLPLSKPDPAQWAAFVQYVFAIGYRNGLAETNRLSLN
tara:strand:+ start:15874 stop:16203 length:330 start_codon:yes stop_codon:yes gene_type:complete